jgi:hypothetical protein
MKVRYFLISPEGIAISRLKWNVGYAKDYSLK